MKNGFFTRLGLTKNEIEIYLFLLEYGATIASMIGKRLHIKRVTVYASLEAMEKKGFVRSFKKNNVTYFQVISPDEIVKICEEKTRRDKDLEIQAKAMLPTLLALQKSQTKGFFEVKGKIKYYQGIKAVKQLINETLEEGPEEQLCFGINDFHTQHFDDEWANYTKKRVKIGMKVRSIQPKNKNSIAYKKRDKKELRKTKLISQKRFSADCELNIIGDMIALFTTHGDEPTGTKIYNKEMAETLRNLFEIAWLKIEEDE